MLESHQISWNILSLNPVNKFGNSGWSVNLYWNNQTFQYFAN